MKLIPIIILMLSVYSCEYDPPEKMTYVDPDVAPPVLRDLTLDLNSSTLYICGPTRFNFDISSDGQPVVKVIVDCLDEKFEINSSKGNFVVNPGNRPDGEYKIKIDVYTRSGTGSLADKIGAEGFMFTREWVLLIERPGLKKVAFKKTSIENGFLRLEWEKLDRPYFHSYKIIVSDSALYHTFSETIYDPDVNYFIDSSFVGGKAEFSLFLYLNCDGVPAGFMSDQLIYRYPVSLKFDERPDSLTVSWNENPFNHTVYLTSNQFADRLFLGNAKSYTMKSPGLGSEFSYQVSFKPVAKMPWDHQMYTVYYFYSLGSKTDMKFSRMMYNPELKSYFLKHPMFLRKYDAYTYAKLLSYDYSWDYYDKTTIALSPDRSNVFTTDGNYIIQLNSSTFNVAGRKKFGPAENGNVAYHLMEIVDDSLMYIAYNSSFAIYNYSLGKIVAQVSISMPLGWPGNISISKDQKYMANCSNEFLRVYRRTEGSGFEKIFDTQGNFLECIFDPVNNNNLLIVTPDDSYILSCPDMQKVFDIPDGIKGMAVNFDPVTNYVLFVSFSSKTITVYDYLKNVVIYQCNHHGYYDEFYLADNTIFHSEGYNIKINTDGK